MVHHNLLANCEQTAIQHIYSKAQALSQCRQLAEQEHAARDVCTRWPARPTPRGWCTTGSPNAAAVASRQAAVRYGIRVLFANIEDYAEQRDAVRRHRPDHDSTRTGNDKTAIMFQISSHSPGALADVLASRSRRTRST